MWEKLKKVGPFWWFVAFFVVINLLWIGPTLLGANTLRRGSEAPGFSLPILRGDDAHLSLEDLRGRTVMLVFWATWCDACMSELAVIGEMDSRYADEDLAIVGMNLEPENRTRVARFLEGHAIGYPNVTVDASTSTAYGIRVLPAIYIVDGEGRVCRGYTGRTGGWRLSRAVDDCIARGAD